MTIVCVLTQMECDDEAEAGKAFNEVRVVREIG